MIKNFNDLLTFTKNRINFVDQDDQVDMILKEALNFAYLKINKEIKSYATAYVPVIDGVATLPDDALEVMDIDPALKAGDAVKGNSILTSNTGTLKVIYVPANEPLVNDTDLLEIPEKYIYPLSLYAASHYYGFKKKTNMADYYMFQYNNAIQELNIEQFESYGSIQNFYEGWV